MKPVSLSTKLFVWILLAAIIPAITLMFTYLYSFKTELIQHKVEDLSRVADAKIREFEVYINEVMIDSRLVAQSLSAENTLKNWNYHTRLMSQLPNLVTRMEFLKPSLKRRRNGKKVQRLR